MLLVGLVELAKAQGVQFEGSGYGDDFLVSHNARTARVRYVSPLVWSCEDAKGTRKGTRYSCTLDAVLSVLYGGMRNRIKVFPYLEQCGDLMELRVGHSGRYSKIEFGEECDNLELAFMLRALATELEKAT